MNIGIRDNVQQYSFKGGLTKVLSRKLYSSDMIGDIVQIYPRTKVVVGALPSDWIKNVDDSKKSEVSKQIFSCFSKTSRKIRYINQKCMTAAEYFIVRRRILGEMKRNLNVLGVPVKKVFSVGQGSFGSVYKLSFDKFFLKKKSYVFKVFHDTLDDSLHGLHGNYREQNAALFLQKRAFKDVNVVKNYFSDVKSGYMVNEFIEERSPYPRFRNPARLGLFMMDANPGNIKDGKLIDYGGLIYLGKTPSSKDIEKTLKSMNYSFRLWSSILYHLPFTDEVKKGLANSAKLFPSSIDRKEAKIMLQDAISESGKGVQ